MLFCCFCFTGSIFRLYLLVITMSLFFYLPIDVAASMVAESACLYMHPCSNIQVAPPTTPCTAQVAGHPRMQTWPAQMRALSATILAAMFTFTRAYNVATLFVYWVKNMHAPLTFEMYETISYDVSWDIIYDPFPGSYIMTLYTPRVNLPLPLGSPPFTHFYILLREALCCPTSQPETPTLQSGMRRYKRNILQWNKNNIKITRIINGDYWIKIEQSKN